ncbi:DNA processing protein [Arcanobacterium wilhelmae]|uniref:DNA processing protein n=1 Tax=Arcanobacterium wilhelmae TaxID=1803177 RepID=A0ABT9N9E1_9ACTO|nr:DNA-processing protein DprA [Arcanobacterium wilhelmae]MDP9800324.1 DNA processing protein [Arcanobacterium wilhelmae]WFN89760.1 DNA-processing protein DprA [Arcanobacterium wilhelmae]
MELDREHAAALDWTRIAEGPDPVAVGIVERMGYAQGLSAVKSGKGLSQREMDARERWLGRLAKLRPFEYECLDKLGIWLLIPSDQEWPAGLDYLGNNRPLALWARGDVSALSQPALAVVGSRDCTRYGARIASNVGYEFASKGIVIVSGGAFGIDGHAHRGALAADGRTVLVSAAGVDRVYPSSHESLYKEVVAGKGAVISESPVGAAPHRFRFLARNRIIAALGLATVVVEAPFKSGALSTARHAMEIGREVAAFPGPIDAPTSVGCNELIRHGATLVTSHTQIAELIEPIGVNPLADDAFFSPATDGSDQVTRRLIDALPKHGGAQLADVARIAGVSMPEAMEGMAKLKGQGKVSYTDGRWKLAGEISLPRRYCE